jgi:glycosyltransferase AglD
MQKKPPSTIPQKAPYFCDSSVMVSVVLPAYNEVDYVEPAVTQITQKLKELDYSYEIIIAEDGSKDDTDKKAAMLSQTILYVKHIHSEKRLGRGRALTDAFNQSKGEVLVYMDLDLATDLKYLKPLIEAIKLEELRLLNRFKNASPKQS